jgi:hypothetical protein
MYAANQIEVVETMKNGGFSAVVAAPDIRSQRIILVNSSLILLP